MFPTLILVFIYCNLIWQCLRVIHNHANSTHLRHGIIYATYTIYHIYNHSNNCSHCRSSLLTISPSHKLWLSRCIAQDGTDIPEADLVSVFQQYFCFPTNKQTNKLKSTQENIRRKYTRNTNIKCAS